jgi:hypothetical protein
VKAIRKVYENLPEVIRVPDNLKNRRVEVILHPLGEATQARRRTQKGGITIDEFLGAWKGEPLERGEQGDYESRESLK